MPALLLVFLFGCPEPPEGTWAHAQWSAKGCDKHPTVECRLDQAAVMCVEEEPVQLDVKLTYPITWDKYPARCNGTVSGVGDPVCQQRIFYVGPDGDWDWTKMRVPVVAMTSTSKSFQDCMQKILTWKAVIWQPYQGSPAETGWVPVLDPTLYIETPLSLRFSAR